MDSVPVDFNPQKYLDYNPDVAAAGVDPILHWVRFGKKEGRKYKNLTLFEKSESQYPKLALLLMQKNEGYMLEAWIKHHITIVPPQHIYIIDNGSKDFLTLSILEYALSLGCNVEKRFDSENHFLQKGTVMVLNMFELDSFNDFDFYIILDTDEFLAVEINEQIEVFSDAIHSSLAALPRSGVPLKIVKGLIADPNRAGYFQKTSVSKTFFLRETAKSLAKVTIGGKQY
jgi:hypothetical protein